jgi:hypothetical protein
MKRVAREIDVTQLVVGDLLVGGIVGSVQCGLDVQAGTGGCVLKQVDHDLMELPRFGAQFMAWHMDTR